MGDALHLSDRSEIFVVSQEGISNQLNAKQKFGTQFEIFC